MDDLQESAEKIFAHFGFSPSKVFADRIESEVDGDILRVTVTKGKWHSQIRAGWRSRRTQRLKMLSDMAAGSMSTFLRRRVDGRVRDATLKMKTAGLG